MHLLHSGATFGLTFATALNIAAQGLSGMAADPALAAKPIEGSVASVDSSQARIDIALPPPIGLRSLTVDDPSIKAALAKLQPEDIVQVEVDPADNPQHIKTLGVATRNVNGWGRISTLAVAIVLLVGLAALATRGKPRNFLLGVDNRYSNSQCQLALWFATVMTIYLSILILRVWMGGWNFLGGVEIPTNILAISGLSALTFGGAKVITAQKVDAATGSDQPSLKVPAAKPNLLSDLVQNDKGYADIGDFQMMFITGLAVIIYLLSGFIFLGNIALQGHVLMPDIDTTLLSGFGLGQGAYLIKKMALKPGDG